MQYVGLQTQVRRNNLRSTILLILFPIIIVGLTWLFFIIITQLSRDSSYDMATGMEIANHQFMQAVPWVIGACGVWFLIAYAANTSIINSATHSQPLSRKDNKRVYNLVENLSMASGMPMPKVNVIEDSSMNAFASGINNKTFSVTLTRGAIDRLNDEELEGVIAHEMSHIRNRDVRLLIISIIFVGIFSFIAQMAIRASFGARVSRSSDNKGNSAAIMIIVALLLSAVGYLISLLLRFAISRQREFMADAGAAQMTKKPLALASALRKISGDYQVEAVTRKDVAQLFIENSSQAKSDSNKTSLFSTHPPIGKRIQVLEQF